MKNISQNKLKIWINIILVILWCGTIFYLSSRTAPQSRGQSKPIAESIVKTVEDIEKKPSAPSVFKKKVHDLENSIRDIAHSGCYFFLALLFINLLYILNLKNWKAFFTTVIFCMLYALSDEIHQLFVPGRAFQIIDLFNDFIGVLFGVGIFYLFILFLNIIQRRKHNQREKY